MKKQIENKYLKGIIDGAFDSLSSSIEEINELAYTFVNSNNKELRSIAKEILQNKDKVQKEINKKHRKISKIIGKSVSNSDKNKILRDYNCILDKRIEKLKSEIELHHKTDNTNIPTYMRFEIPNVVSAYILKVKEDKYILRAGSILALGKSCKISNDEIRLKRDKLIQEENLKQTYLCDYGCTKLVVNKEFAVRSLEEAQIIIMGRDLRPSDNKYKFIEHS